MYQSAQIVDAEPPHKFIVAKVGMLTAVSLTEGEPNPGVGMSLRGHQGLALPTAAEECIHTRDRRSQMQRLGGDARKGLVEAHDSPWGSRSCFDTERPESTMGKGMELTETP